MTGTRTATAYIQIADRQVRGSWRPDTSATVVKVTNTPPERLEPGCVLVKVQIRVPREAWAPAMPAVVVDVPLDLVGQSVEAEAVQP